ncbi:hypothetical protein PF011_g25412 [Phytophthora fragariae]|uniref:Uncharacterized protein n=1 Tax=Phytophthora fragariae TaxID=53985 RepID=A0A6A3HUC6_9STRA|nr:hypothetical protein PF011_g25412 [Phytophthora fragariae]
MQVSPRCNSEWRAAEAIVTVKDESATMLALLVAQTKTRDVESPEVVTAGHIVERARRRVRNRAGRYVLEHEVEYSERPGMHVERRWLTAEKFEELLDAGKVEDDLAAGDDV